MGGFSSGKQVLYPAVACGVKHANKNRGTLRKCIYLRIMKGKPQNMHTHHPELFYKTFHKHMAITQEHDQHYTIFHVFQNFSHFGEMLRIRAPACEK